jgi:glycosyltransferase involved in cell wall biosynthesis
MPLELSVIIPTHNGNQVRLDRVFAGLSAQTLPGSHWEVIVVDNGSQVPFDPAAHPSAATLPLRSIREPQLGLTHARRRGFSDARAPLCVLVDDDNVLAPDYLAQAIRSAERYSNVGSFGGRSVPEFEREPNDWQREFLDLLALRDLGAETLVSQGLRPPGSARNVFPAFAPIGAGMIIRREFAVAWAARKENLLSDRSGQSLSSGGDNDLVFFVLQRGAEVAYVPELSLTHLIPATRLESSYLGRLNRGIQKSWMQVLSAYDANPWPPIPAWTVPLRQGKAWFSHRAWSSPRNHVRWQGACGHFEGRVPIRPIVHS